MVLGSQSSGQSVLSIRILADLGRLWQPSALQRGDGWPQGSNAGHIVCVFYWFAAVIAAVSVFTLIVRFVFGVCFLCVCGGGLCYAHAHVWCKIILSCSLTNQPIVFAGSEVAVASRSVSVIKIQSATPRPRPPARGTGGYPSISEAVTVVEMEMLDHAQNVQIQPSLSSFCKKICLCILLHLRLRAGRKVERKIAPPT